MDRGRPIDTSHPPESRKKRPRRTAPPPPPPAQHSQRGQGSPAAARSSPQPMGGAAYAGTLWDEPSRAARERRTHLAGDAAMVGARAPYGFLGREAGSFLGDDDDGGRLRSYLLVAPRADAVVPTTTTTTTAFLSLPPSGALLPHFAVPSTLLFHPFVHSPYSHHQNPYPPLAALDAARNLGVANGMPPTSGWDGLLGAHAGPQVLVPLRYVEAPALPPTTTTTTTTTTMHPHHQLHRFIHPLAAVFDAAAASASSSSTASSRASILLARHAADANGCGHDHQGAAHSVVPELRRATEAQEPYASLAAAAGANDVGAPSAACAAASGGKRRKAATATKATATAAPAPSTNTGPFLSVPMARRADATYSSRYQCLLREQIEYFEADDVALRAKAQGRNVPLKPRQVGIRCVHCARSKAGASSSIRRVSSRRRRGDGPGDPPLSNHDGDRDDMIRGAVYYPTRLSNLYQAVQNMANNHFVSRACPSASASLLDEILEARRTRPRRSGCRGKRYVGQSAEALGIEDAEDGSGIFFVAGAGTAAKANAAHLKTTNKRPALEGQGTTAPV